MDCKDTEQRGQNAANSTEPTGFAFPAHLIDRGDGHFYDHDQEPHPTARDSPQSKESEAPESPAREGATEPSGDVGQSGNLAQGDSTPFILDDAKPLDVKSFPDRPQARQGRLGELPATIANIRHLLKGYGITVRYNTIKKKLLINLPGHTGISDNADNTAMTQIISLSTLNGIAFGQIPAIVELLGDRNLYNPVAEWTMSKPWDGQDRMPALFQTLTEREGYSPQLKRILIYKWLLSAVAAALKPSGFKGRGVLTIQGPQSLGKTSWLISLVDDLGLREMVVKVDHHLDGSNKDSILGAITHWLVEIGELDSSFKKDIARLKGFLTSDGDKVRRPYARAESEYPRRTVFYASVNDSNFLVDATGNTRWWTIPVTAINFEHGIDMQQVYAQLAVDFNNGAEWWLSKDEEALLESHNTDHRAVSVIRERLTDWLDLRRLGMPDNPYRSTTEILNALGFERPGNAEAKELTAILRELLGDSRKVQGSQKWRVPVKHAQVDTNAAPAPPGSGPDY